MKTPPIPICGTTNRSPIPRLKRFQVEQGLGSMDQEDRSLIQGIFFKMVPTFTRMLTKVAFHGWDSLAYTTNEKCNVCGVCKKICPVHNIHLENGHPIWEDHCVYCFACFQRRNQFGNTYNKARGLEGSPGKGFLHQQIA